MLIAPTAVAAFSYGDRLIIRNIGYYSARFCVLYKSADGNGYNKIRRTLTGTTAAAALLT